VKSVLLLIATVILLATPVFADEKTDAAIKALQALETDSAKLAPFCAIVKDMSNLGEGDDAESNDLEAKMEEYLKSLGPDYALAWSLGENLDPSSPESAALDAAFDHLEDKCGN
jgi:hypothetical protein